MRRTVVAVFVACLLLASAQPLASKKKNKKDYNAILKTLQTVYVDGSSLAVSYIRRNLSQETCLSNTMQESEADAILEVWEESPVPCSSQNRSMYSACCHMSAKLLDPKTKDVLWFRDDENLPLVDLAHQLNGPYKWVLWNLNSSCCKGRLLSPNPKDSKP